MGAQWVRRPPSSGEGLEGSREGGGSERQFRGSVMRDVREVRLLGPRCSLQPLDKSLLDLVPPSPSILTGPCAVA